MISKEEMLRDVLIKHESTGRSTEEILIDQLFDSVSFSTNLMEIINEKTHEKQLLQNIIDEAIFFLKIYDEIDKDKLIAVLKGSEDKGSKNEQNNI